MPCPRSIPAQLFVEVVSDIRQVTREQETTLGRGYIIIYYGFEIKKKKGGIYERKTETTATRLDIESSHFAVVKGSLGAC